MGEVQEQRHVCKVCGKPCVTGRSLGGHMRAHLVTKAEIKRGGEGDDDQNTSYGLRENPKKSWRNLIPDPKSCLYLCEECGKEFPSSRALSGHMRNNSNKECKKCGKGFDSIRAMFGHMKSHSKKRSSDDGDNPFADSFSGFQNIRKKRSTIRYNTATKNPCLSYLDEYNKCGGAAVEDEEDMEEVAGILIVLSKGDFDFDFVCGVDKENSVCEFDGLGSCFGAKDELDKDFLVPANEEPADSENKAKLGMIKLGFDRNGKGKEHGCLVCFKVFPSGFISTTPDSGLLLTEGNEML